MTAITETLKLSIRREQEKNKTLHLLNELCLSLEARIMANIKDYDVAELEDFVMAAKHLNKVAGKKYDVAHVENYLNNL
jgi:predicted DNA-binding protein